MNNMFQKMSDLFDLMQASCSFWPLLMAFAVELAI
ncbi:hypothetical protein swp_3087 [Shewanella piezotolerans WP3]|uniref:Uncharacterized protein n=1 Tax=Shewanella piezotolerans (strain WP3 / JCM 13877) TaxID=225849 RepID=B8CPT9_SHEPW|nr:hypothetical protein swp_3087 [Shewanella piezotolerans WP3]